MEKLDNEFIFKQLNWRYACKKFDPDKKIRESDWNVLSESLRLSPSSYGLQPWKFIIVQNPDLRKKLFASSYNQTPVVEASHFVVLCYKEKMDEAHIDRHISNIAQANKLDLSALDRTKLTMMGDLVTGPRAADIYSWAQRQVYIAMGTLLTTAAMMGIDTLPMEGLKAEEYDQILDLKGTGWKTCAAVACGYRSAEDKFQKNPKIRFPASEVIEYKN